MDDIRKDNLDFFDLLKTSRKRKTGFPDVYFQSIDAEWFEQHNRNEVLSYQSATVSMKSINNIILYTNRGQRKKLIELIEAGIRSVNGGKLPPFQPGRKVLVGLIAHNFSSEWSVFEDRDADYIIKKLMVIRKTPVTGYRSIKLNLSDHTPDQRQLNLPFGDN